MKRLWRGATSRRQALAPATDQEDTDPRKRVGDSRAREGGTCPWTGRGRDNCAPRGGGPLLHADPLCNKTRCLEMRHAALAQHALDCSIRGRLVGQNVQTWWSSGQCFSKSGLCFGRAVAKLGRLRHECGRGRLEQVKFGRARAQFSPKPVNAGRDSAQLDQRRRFGGQVLPNPDPFERKWATIWPIPCNIWPIRVEVAPKLA